jgi:hypothetical protein
MVLRGHRRTAERLGIGCGAAKRKKNPLLAACATEIDGLLGRLIALVPSS